MLIPTLILFAVSVPNVMGIVTLRIEESKSPIEAEEEIEEYLLNGHRLGVTVRHRKRPPGGRGIVTASRFIQSGSAVYIDGHRLANGLLAPLTC